MRSHAIGVKVIAGLVGKLQKAAREFASAEPIAVDWKTAELAEAGAELSEEIRKLQRRKPERGE